MQSCPIQTMHSNTNTQRACNYAKTGPTLGISLSFGILTLLLLPSIVSISLFWK
jgi:hypothetical protein